MLTFNTTINAVDNGVLIANLEAIIVKLSAGVTEGWDTGHGASGDYKFTVEGEAGITAERFAEMMNERVLSTLDEMNESDLIDLASLDGSVPVQQLIYVPSDNSIATLAPMLTLSDDVILRGAINIDTEEASQAAYALAFEEMGLSGNFDEMAATEQADKDPDMLFEKRDEHIVGYVKDVISGTDWVNFYNLNPDTAQTIAKNEDWI
jgi:hypothetical protein